MLKYSHLSSLSRLPDEQDSYSILCFELNAGEQQGMLTFTASHFPTETIYKHLAFYWNVSLELLKRFAEKQDWASDF